MCARACVCLDLHRWVGRARWSWHPVGPPSSLVAGRAGSQDLLLFSGAPARPLSGTPSLVTVPVPSRALPPVRVSRGHRWVPRESACLGPGEVQCSYFSRNPGTLIRAGITDVCTSGPVSQMCARLERLLVARPVYSLIPVFSGIVACGSNLVTVPISRETVSVCGFPGWRQTGLWRLISPGTICDCSTSRQTQPIPAP